MTSNNIKEENESTISELKETISDYEEEIETMQNQYDILFQEKDSLERTKKTEIEALTAKIQLFKKQFENIL